MDALEALTNRKSAAMLIEPAPNDNELAQIFAAAVRAPDHARPEDPVPRGPVMFDTLSPRLLQQGTRTGQASG